MREVWLRSNTRLYWVIIAAGLINLAAAITDAIWRGPRMAHGVGIAAVGVLLLLAGLRIRRPRLAYEAGHLLLWLGLRRPYRVPIEFVEGFFLGHGPSYLPGKQAGRLDTSTLVIRLAEKAAAWEQQPAKSQIASWCGHYVTIRGTWCEPLTLELVYHLNARLYEVTHPSQPARVSA